MICGGMILAAASCALFLGMHCMLRAAANGALGVVCSGVISATALFTLGVC